MRLIRRADEPRREELEALLAAARAAVEHADLERALEAILDAAIGLVGGDEGSVMLLDPHTMTLRVVASRGLDAEARSLAVPMGHGVSGTVAVTGQPLLLPRAVDVERFAGYVRKERKIFGSLCVPLRTRDATIGVVSVNAMLPGGQFTQRDLQLVSIFAETAALAITNSRLLEEARRHATELEVLSRAAARLGASPDIDAVAEAALDEALAIAGTEAGFVCIGPPGALELLRSHGFAPDRVQAAVCGPSPRTFSADDVHVIPNVSSLSDLAPLRAELGDRALALIPLRSTHRERVGMLGVALAPGASGDERRLLWTFAAHAGTAVANALERGRLAAREADLALLVEGTGAAIVLVDAAERIRALSPAAARLLRLSSEGDIGRSARGALGAEIERLGLDDRRDLETSVRLEGRLYRLLATTVRSGHQAGARVLRLSPS